MCQPDFCTTQRMVPTPLRRQKKSTNEPWQDTTVKWKPFKGFYICTAAQFHQVVWKRDQFFSNPADKLTNKTINQNKPETISVVDWVCFQILKWGLEPEATAEMHTSPFFLEDQVKSQVFEFKSGHKSLLAVMSIPSSAAQNTTLLYLWNSQHAAHHLI